MSKHVFKLTRVKSVNEPGVFVEETFNTFEEAVQYLDEHVYTISRPRNVWKTSLDTKATLPMISATTFKGDVTNKDTADMVYGLMLDYDSGLRYEDFKLRYPTLKHYAHSSVSTDKDKEKFRVIVPLTEPVHISVLYEYRHSLKEYFKDVDTSTFARGRRFYIPAVVKELAELHFTNYVDGDTFTLTDLELIESTRIMSGAEVRNTINLTPEMKNTIHKEIVEPYIAAGTDDAVNFPWTDVVYSRNDGFYQGLRRVASYGIGSQDCLAIASQMNWDGKRNSIESTVENAINSVTSVMWESIRPTDAADGWSYIPTNQYLSSQTLELKGKTLLLAQTGLGKSDYFFRANFNERIIFAVPTIMLGHEMLGKANSLAKTKSVKLIVGDSENKDFDADINICTYDQLVSRILPQSLDNDIVIIDEFHKILTDDFRLNTMDRVVEFVIKSNAKSTVCLSGTFTPEDAKGIVEFDKVYKFKRKRSPRQLNYVEAADILAALKTNVLTAHREGYKSMVLLDNKSQCEKLKVTLEALGITVTILNRETDEVFSEIARTGGFSTDVLLHTQVLLEGVSITDGEVGNIAMVGRKWSDAQIVQYLERIRTFMHEHTATLLVSKSRSTESEPVIRNVMAEVKTQNNLVDFLNSETDPEAIIRGMKNELGISSIDSMYMKDPLSGKYLRSFLYPYIVAKRGIRAYTFYNLAALKEQLAPYDWHLETKSIDNTRLSREEKEVGKAAVEALKNKTATQKMKLLDTVLAAGGWATYERGSDERAMQEQLTILMSFLQITDAGEKIEKVKQIFKAGDEGYYIDFINQKEDNRMGQILMQSVKVGDALTGEDRKDLYTNVVKELRSRYKIDTTQFKKSPAAISNAFKTFFEYTEKRKDNKRYWEITCIGKSRV